jgi:hypothetical protein
MDGERKMVGEREIFLNYATSGKCIRRQACRREEINRHKNLYKDKGERVCMRSFWGRKRQNIPTHYGAVHVKGERHRKHNESEREVTVGEEIRDDVGHTIYTNNINCELS